MRTDGTLARGVTRVHGNNRDSAQLRLVLNLGSQIKKRPILVPVSLSFSNRYSLTNALQIFKGDRSLSAFSLFDQTLRYAVVYILLESGLLARELFEFSLRRLRTLALKISATVGQRLPNSLDTRTGELFAVRVGGDVDDAEINAKYILTVVRGLLGNVTNRIQIELTLAIDQVHLAFTVLKQVALPIPADVSDVHSTADCPYRHLLVFLKGDAFGMKGDCPQRSELALRMRRDFVRVSHFCNALASHLRSKVKAFASFVIHEVVKFELSKDLVDVGLMADEIADFIASPDRPKQRIGLKIQRLQLNVNY